MSAWISASVRTGKSKKCKLSMSSTVHRQIYTAANAQSQELRSNVQMCVCMCKLLSFRMEFVGRSRLSWHTHLCQVSRQTPFSKLTNAYIHTFVHCCFLASTYTHTHTRTPKEKNLNDTITHKATPTADHYKSFI